MSIIFQIAWAPADFARQRLLLFGAAMQFALADGQKLRQFLIRLAVAREVLELPAGDTKLTWEYLGLTPEDSVPPVPKVGCKQDAVCILSAIRVCGGRLH